MNVPNFFLRRSTGYPDYTEIRCKLCDFNLPFVPIDGTHEKEMKDHLRSHRDQITKALQSDDNCVPQWAQNLENDIKEIRNQLDTLTNIVVAHYGNQKSSETGLAHVQKPKKATVLVEQQQCGVSSASEPTTGSPAVRIREKRFSTHNGRQGRRKFSPVWTFFDDFGPSIYCKVSNPDGSLCGQRLIQRKRMCEFLESHLKSKHGEMYANYLEMKMIAKENGQPAVKRARIENNISPELSAPPAPQPECSGTVVIKEELDLDDLSHLLPNTSTEYNTTESSRLYQGLEAIDNKKSASWQSGHLF